MKYIVSIGDQRVAVEAAPEVPAKKPSSRKKAETAKEPAEVSAK